jgi:hypothetical protein
MLPASAHYQEKVVDVVCLLPQPSRKLLMLSASAHNQERAVNMACLLREQLMLPASTHHPPLTICLPPSAFHPHSWFC